MGDRSAQRLKAVDFGLPRARLAVHVVRMPDGDRIAKGAATVEFHRRLGRYGGSA